MTRIAIMQPYFVPYTGYFKLMQSVDVFVFLDSVQFTRRGWIHRNKFTTIAGGTDWLTLPLKKSNITTRIRELEFCEDFEAEFARRTKRFSAFSSPANQFYSLENWIAESKDPNSFLQHGLIEISNVLGFTPNFNRSSELSLNPDLKSQDMILEICRYFSAKSYVNLPGGMSLYDHSVFEARNIELKFVDHFSGNKISVYERLCTESLSSIKLDIEKMQIT
jgi:hypothetical protein